MQRPVSASVLSASSHAFVGDLYLRSYKPLGTTRGVLLFVHGATVASDLFDIQVPGYSLMAACAAAGWWSFACDLTGYGKSRRPDAMQLTPLSCPVICTGDQAVKDLSDIVAHLRLLTGCDQIVLAGGSWGSITAARYAASHSKSIEKLVLLAPLFACINPSWLRMLADPEQPDRLNPALGGYRYVREQDLLSRWDSEIPPGHTAQRRDAKVLAAMVRAAIQADSECPVRGAFRVPNGTLHDLFEAFSGRALYSPEKLRMPCLLVRGSDDQTSTAQDADSLLRRLATTNKEKITLPDAGHFMQAERCAAELQNLICDYLNS